MFVIQPIITLLHDNNTTTSKLILLNGASFPDAIPIPQKIEKIRQEHCNLSGEFPTIFKKSGQICLFMGRHF
jgi:hypothetical protein